MPRNSTLTTLANIDAPAIARLFGARLPSPTDVPNLLSLRDPAAYRRYGRRVMPLLLAYGGRLLWAAAHEAALVGEPRGAELLVVRYPSHRRFLAMVLHPYYLAIANPHRVRGVERFEASFTTPTGSCTAATLRRTRLAVVVHYRGATTDAADAVIDDLIERSEGTLVYRSRETAPIRLTKRPGRTEPRRLEFSHMAIVQVADAAAAHTLLDAPAQAKLAAAGVTISAQLYRRQDRLDLVRRRPAG